MEIGVLGFSSKLSVISATGRPRGRGRLGARGFRYSYNAKVANDQAGVESKSYHFPRKTSTTRHKNCDYILSHRLLISPDSTNLNRVWQWSRLDLGDASISNWPGEARLLAGGMNPDRIFREDRHRGDVSLVFCAGRREGRHFIISHQ